MRVSKDYKKTIEIFEKKQDLEEYVIKPNWNTFDILSQTVIRSICSNDMALTSNDSQKCIQKCKIFLDSTNLTEL